MAERRTQTERTAATRRALIDAARGLFAADGYAATPAEAIVRRAEVTRGALYHHFEDKKDLFRAVVEEIEHEIDERVRTAAVRGSDAAEAFVAGTDAFLDACLLPDVKQILLIDGPSVLGWQEWRDTDARHAVGQIERGLEGLIEAGVIDRRPVRPLAHLIHGALVEAALFIAASDAPTAARAEIGTSFARLLGHPGLWAASEPSGRRVPAVEPSPIRASGPGDAGG